METWIDPERVKQMKAGDRKVWDEFFTVYRPLFSAAVRVAAVRAGAKSLLFHEREFQDAVDQAMAHFFEGFARGFEEFRGETAFRAYLFGSARYFLFQQQREKGKDLNFSQLDDLQVDTSMLELKNRRELSGTLEVEEKKELLSILLECVGRLPRHYRVVVNLYHFSQDRLTLSEVGQALSLSLSAVKARRVRALKQIADCVHSHREVKPA